MHDGVATGFATTVGYDVALSDAVDMAAETGCDFVELLLDGEAHPDRLDVDGLAADLAAAGLDLIVHLPFGLALGSQFDAQREGAVATHRECLDVATALDAEKAVLHPQVGGWSFPWDDDVVEATVARSVREVCEHAAGNGIQVCVENLPDGRYTVDRLPDLLDATGAPMVLDTGHARAAGLDSAAIAAFAAEHRDRISHVHLNDTRGEDDEHLPFGYGTVDFPAVFDALGDDWTGTLTLELVTPNLDYVASSVERLHGMVR